MRDALIALLVLGVMVVGGRVLFRRSRAAPPPLHVPSEDGTFTLLPSRRVTLMLAVSALVPAVVLGGVTFRGRSGSAVGLGVGAAATLAVLAAAVYLFASAFRTRLVVRDTGIERFGVFRHRVIGWRSVARIAFNPAEQWFFITMSDRSRLWVPVHVPGIGDFARLALRRVNAAVLDADGPAVREVLEDLAGLARKGRGAYQVAPETHPDA